MYWINVPENAFGNFNIASTAVTQLILIHGLGLLMLEKIVLFLSQF
jgi:hypothetical protein